MITKYVVVDFCNVTYLPLLVAVKEFIMRTCSPKIVSADECVDNAILPSSKTCYCTGERCNDSLEIKSLASGSPIIRATPLLVATVVFVFVPIA